MTLNQRFFLEAVNLQTPFIFRDMMVFWGDLI